jgi:plasmid stabilization system protein ParE
VKPLLLRDAARTDLSEVFQWYEKRRPGLGYEFLQATRVTLGALERNPEEHPLVAADIRKAPLRRFPYLVYFVVLDAGVSVIAVMHGRRNPQRWQERR